MLEKLRRGMVDAIATAREVFPDLTSGTRMTVMAALFSTACNNAKPQECPAADSSTSAQMQYSWNEASAHEEVCRLEAELEADDCREKDEADTGDCNDEQDLAEEMCQFGFMKAVNKLPLRECGEPIFSIVGDDPLDANYGWEVNQEDFDGDGIGSYDEFTMGLNPCSERSFETGEECLTDGEQDHDADGIPNGDDKKPRCYGDFGEEDPGAYGSDCV